MLYQALPVTRVRLFIYYNLVFYHICNPQYTRARRSSDLSINTILPTWRSLSSPAVGKLPGNGKSSPELPASIRRLGLHSPPSAPSFALLSSHVEMYMIMGITSFSFRLHGIPTYRYFSLPPIFTSESGGQSKEEDCDEAMT